MRALSISIVATVCFLFSHAAGADFIFDFGTADRTFLGSGPLAPVDPMPVPGTSDFIPTLGAPNFLVGNLTNYCGLFPGDGTSSKTGTTCIDPHDGTLSDTINYDTGADTFTLTEDTELLLQLIVKLGHPERFPSDPSLTQNQDERFDIFLVGSDSSTLMLAQLLDDVDSDLGDVSNGYYRYVYQPMIVPAGTWYPSFVSVHGSIEFLTQLSKPVPEPGTLLLFGSGLLGLAFAGWRRRQGS
jgi:PEP-CTERM motif